MPRGTKDNPKSWAELIYQLAEDEGVDPYFYDKLDDIGEYITRLGFEILTYQNNIKMKKETKQQNSTDTQMGYDTVLAPVSRNYLRRGDKVRMKDGEILTVRSLEFREFCAEGKVGYIPKKDIDTVME